MPIPYPTKPAPFRHSWWVTDTLLAGPYPGDVDESTAERNLKSILDRGVTVFVNLQEPTETGMGNEPFPDYRPVVRRLNHGSESEPIFHRFPIRDMGVPSAETVGEALDRIDEAHGAGRGVYIHCWGGHGRTGTIVGCWMVRHGLSAEQALARIIELRRHDDYLRWMESPQTRAQANVIRSWPPP
ncbi:MAG: hypothetical protein R3F07_03680 [Opitutaceae bacterium]